MKYPYILILIPILLLLPWTAAMGQSLRAEDLYAAQHHCADPVEDREDAARCFSVYFEARLELLRSQRGTMPSRVEELYQPVAEQDVYIRRGSYHISRDGCGSPYFIDNGVIYLDLN